MLSIGDFRSPKVFGTFVFHWQQAQLAAAGGSKSLLSESVSEWVCVCVWGLPPSIRTETTTVIHFSCEPFCHIKTQRIYKFEVHQWIKLCSSTILVLYAGDTHRSDTMKTVLRQHSLHSAHHASQCARAIRLIIFDRGTLKLSHYSLMQSSCWFASVPWYFIYFRSLERGKPVDVAF